MRIADCGIRNAGCGNGTETENKKERKQKTNENEMHANSDASWGRLLRRLGGGYGTGRGRERHLRERGQGTFRECVVAIRRIREQFSEALNSNRQSVRVTDTSLVPTYNLRIPDSELFFQGASSGS